MPKPPPVEDTLAETIEQLVLERINGYGECESTAVQAAYRQFDAAAAKLKATLSPEQSKLFIDCENAIKSYGEVGASTSFDCRYRLPYINKLEDLLRKLSTLDYKTTAIKPLTSPHGIDKISISTIMYYYL